MKKILIAAAVTATFMSSQAFAQAKNFEGGYIGVNLVSASTTMEATLPGFSGKADASPTDLTLVLGYDFAVSDKVVLGVGVDVGMLTRKLGTVSGTTVDVETKSNVGVFGTLGYTVSDTVLVYGKIAQQSSNLKSSVGGNVYFNGPAFGLGVKALFDKNLEGSVEFMQNTYGDQTIGTETDKLKSTSFSIGVAYKF